MKLEHRRIHIEDIQFGEKTSIKSGVLMVNQEELIELLKEDDKIQDIKVDIARPGEKRELSL